jgi:hypothetical protein
LNKEKKNQQIKGKACKRQGAMLLVQNPKTCTQNKKKK